MLNNCHVSIEKQIIENKYQQLFFSYPYNIDDFRFCAIFIQLSHVTMLRDDMKKINEG